MSLTNKKSFKKIWSAIEPTFMTGKSRSVQLEDKEFSIGYNRTTYLMLNLNNIDVFFIIDTDDSSVTIFSHKEMTVEIYETAVLVQNLLFKNLFTNQFHQAKATKSD